MIKIIGAILIAAASAAWGIGGVMKLRGRARSLASITASLEVIKNEICDRYTQMPELLDILSVESAYPASLFYKNVRKEMCKIGEKSFSSIWSSAVTNTPELLMTPQEMLTLSELGYSLGKYNAGEQRGAILYAKRRLEIFTKRAEDERDKDSKVQAMLGLASGILVIIVLL